MPDSKSAGKRSVRPPKDTPSDLMHLHVPSKKETHQTRVDREYHTGGVLSEKEIAKAIHDSYLFDVEPPVIQAPCSCSTSGFLCFAIRPEFKDDDSYLQLTLAL